MAILGRWLIARKGWAIHSRIISITTVGIAFQLSLLGQSAYAFNFGNFLKSLSGKEVTGNRRFHSVKEGSTSSSCRGIYKRDMSNYGWQYQPEYSEGPCPDEAIEQLKQKERSAYVERVYSCRKFIKDKYEYRIDAYASIVSSRLCDDYASGKDISTALQEQLDYYSGLVNENRRRIAREEKESTERAYSNALAWASSAQSQINRTKSARAFIYDGNRADRVYVHSIVLPSMRQGVTLGGSNIVDVNIRTQAYELRPAETRYRIFCSEGKHSVLEDGIPVAGTSFISREMGRWVCARYGLYHP